MHKDKNEISMSDDSAYLIIGSVMNTFIYYIVPALTESKLNCLSVYNQVQLQLMMQNNKPIP